MEEYKTGTNMVMLSGSGPEVCASPAHEVFGPAASLAVYFVLHSTREIHLMLLLPPISACLIAFKPKCHHLQPSTARVFTV